MPLIQWIMQLLPIGRTAPLPRTSIGSVAGPQVAMRIDGPAVAMTATVGPAVEMQAIGPTVEMSEVPGVSVDMTVV